MSVERCFMCDRDIDTDFNVEHFYESDCAILAAQQKLKEIITYRDSGTKSSDVYQALCASFIDICGWTLETVLDEQADSIKRGRKT